MHMYSCIEPKHEASMLSVKDEKATGEQNFARRRDYARWLSHLVRAAASIDVQSHYNRRFEGWLWKVGGWKEESVTLQAHWKVLA